MKFRFTDDQLELRDAVRTALEGECTPGAVRDAWDAPDTTVWSTLAELGVLGINAPEDVGGLGMGPCDWVLLQEEAGRFALPGPFIETIAAVPYLAEAGQTELLEQVITGEALVTVGERYAVDADRAALVLLVDGEDVVAIRDPKVTPRSSQDGARRLFEVRGMPIELSGNARRLQDRAALAASAQLLGLGRRLLDTAVAYAKERNQFGKAIGSFQAVQHPLATALMRLEFAAPTVYRAAWSLEHDQPDASLHVSMAKAMASDAAWLASRTALQTHGAIGYTWEYDLHLWMKRVWALAAAWGDAPTHRERVARSILDHDPVKGDVLA